MMHSVGNHCPEVNATLPCGVIVVRSRDLRNMPTGPLQVRWQRLHPTAF